MQYTAIKYLNPWTLEIIFKASRISTKKKITKHWKINLTWKECLNYSGD